MQEKLQYFQVYLGIAVVDFGIRQMKNGIFYFDLRLIVIAGFQRRSQDICVLDVDTNPAHLPLTLFCNLPQLI